MRRIYLITGLLICATLTTLAQSPDAMQFTRPTLKGTVLSESPVWHVEIYRDQSYQFVYRHYGNAEYAPGLFAHNLVRNQWLEITHLSTEHARLGRSPDFSDIPLPVGWDFQPLARLEYALVPLKTSGSIVFPDKITLLSTADIYRFDCNSELNRDPSLTSFWVRKADLDGIH